MVLSQSGVWLLFWPDTISFRTDGHFPAVSRLDRHDCCGSDWRPLPPRPGPTRGAPRRSRALMGRRGGLPFPPAPVRYTGGRPTFPGVEARPVVRQNEDPVRASID